MLFNCGTPCAFHISIITELPERFSLKHARQLVKLLHHTKKVLVELQRSTDSAFVLTITIEVTADYRFMGAVHSSVMGTIFHSSDVSDTKPEKMYAEATDGYLPRINQMFFSVEYASHW